MVIHGGDDRFTCYGRPPPGETADDAAPGTRGRVSIAEAAKGFAGLAREGFPRKARALALTGYEAARAESDTIGVAAMADALVICCVMLAEYEDAMLYARIAESIWRAAGNAACEAVARASVAVVLGTAGDERALAEAEAALSVARLSGDTDAVVDALLANAFCVSLHVDPGRSAALCAQALALGAREHRAVLARINLAESRVQEVLAAAPEVAGGRSVPAAPVAGRLLASLALTEEAVSLAHAGSLRDLERIALLNMAEYNFYLGELDAMETWLAAADQVAGEESVRVTGHIRLMRARRLLRQGRPLEAIFELEACRSVVAGDVEVGVVCLSDLAAAQAGIGRFEAALRTFQAYHGLYVRRASEAAQGRARMSALRAEVDAERGRADALSADKQSLERETERLLRKSLEDPLTGLANRRSLDVALLELRATGGAYAVSLIDIDHFKQVNDGHSHLVGDDVLRAVAGLLSASARTNDLAVRYGGEEFALVARGAELAAAAGMAERLRAAVEAHDWAALARGLRVTVSVGVASSAEAGTPDGVLALADARLYAAKRGGRDRVAAG